MELYLKKNKKINLSKLSKFYGTETRFYPQKKLEVIHLGSAITGNKLDINDIENIIKSKSK